MVHTGRSNIKASFLELRNYVAGPSEYLSCRPQEAAARQVPEDHEDRRDEERGVGWGLWLAPVRAPFIWSPQSVRNTLAFLIIYGHDLGSLASDSPYQLETRVSDS